MDVRHVGLTENTTYREKLKGWDVQVKQLFVVQSSKQHHLAEYYLLTEHDMWDNTQVLAIASMYSLDQHIFNSSGAW